MATPKKPKGQNGGKRPGAGRPRKAVAHATPIAAAERRLCDHLPELIDNMLKLACGGYQVIEEKFERRRPAREDRGLDDMLSEMGVGVDEPPADEMILIERTVKTAHPDRAANQYLIDRVMGKAAQPIQHEYAGLSDEDLIAAITSTA